MDRKFVTTLFCEFTPFLYIMELHFAPYLSPVHPKTCTNGYRSNYSPKVVDSWVSSPSNSIARGVLKLSCLTSTPFFSFLCVVRLHTCDLGFWRPFSWRPFISTPRYVVSTRFFVEQRPVNLMICSSRSAFRTLFVSLLGFSLLCQPCFAATGEVNVTVDDTDPSIIYEPTTAWFFSGNASGCAVCLTPPSPVAYNNTWHQGLHIPPTPGANNADSASKRRSDGASAVDTSKRRNDVISEKRAVPDPSGDVPVSVQLNFTGPSCFLHQPSSLTSFLGSAIYLFGILPLGNPPNVNSAPTLTNLTFTLDSKPAGNFVHSGSATNQGFQSTVSVFSRRGLSNSAHTLLVNLGPNSVFLFDYYVVSRASADCSDSSPCPTQTQAPTTE